MNVVDLSLPIYDRMEVFEGDPEVRVTTVRSRETDGWELRLLQMGSHTGTHVDAPIHMHSGAATLDELPLHTFCGEATVVSLQMLQAGNSTSGLGLLFFESVSREYGELIVALNPPFVGGPLDESVERFLLSHGIVTYTDLVNVETLLNKKFTFYGFPLRIRHGDGSPVRAVAVLAE